ncbi:MAG: FAD-dependent oxidoreductase [Ruminococcaceae bacterium]|nr:FAD-dependent oxidoreductase [Oscillospiraceae bacterium]
MSSLWKNTVCIPHFPRLERNLHTDVLVIGGGLAGILCAYKLAQEGIDYALVESSQICEKITGSTTAKITFQHGLIYHKLIQEVGIERAKMYLEANRSALWQYRTLAQSIDCDYQIQDAFIYTLNNPEKIQQECGAYQQLGIPAEYTEDLPLPFPVSAGIRLRNQAQLHPLKLAASLVKKLNIYENTPVQAYDGQHIITPHAGITASHIIVATHFPVFNKHGAYFLKMYQQRSYVTAFEGVKMPDGMYLDEAETGFSFRSYGDLLLLGGGSHRTGKRGGGWDQLTVFAKQHYPGATAQYHWAAQDCMTLDGIPYIGEYSKSTPNLYVATGFNKWGFTSAMAAADILCDLIQGRYNSVAPVFSPLRTMLHPQLLKNVLESGLHLLTPTTPRCPHLGCALKWNPQEHSWDCPCHGSRFTEAGDVLNNPANTNGIWALRRKRQ